MKGVVNINDDTGLEKEADIMGEKAMQMVAFSPSSVQAPLQEKSIANQAAFSLCNA